MSPEFRDQLLRARATKSTTQYRAGFAILMATNSGGVFFRHDGRGYLLCWPSREIADFGAKIEFDGWKGRDADLKSYVIEPAQRGQRYLNGHELDMLALKRTHCAESLGLHASLAASVGRLEERLRAIEIQLRTVLRRE